MGRSDAKGRMRSGRKNTWRKGNTPIGVEPSPSTFLERIPPRPVRHSNILPFHSKVVAEVSVSFSAESVPII